MSRECQKHGFKLHQKKTKEKFFYYFVVVEIKAFLTSLKRTYEMEFTTLERFDPSSLRASRQML